MLAMEANDDAGYLTPHGALRFFASMLAPTVVRAIRANALCGFFGARVITNCLTSREDLAITQSLGCVP